MGTSPSATIGSAGRLDGQPATDFSRNLELALGCGRRMASILSEVVALRRSPGKLTPNEYFYFRLWEPGMASEVKRRFIGKNAQHPMHMACNHTGWYAAAADKLLFQTLMAGSCHPMPELLAVAHPDRRLNGHRSLRNKGEIVAFLREPEHYPFFAKPIDGKYSLAVLSADRYESPADQVLLRGERGRTVESVADELGAHRPYRRLRLEHCQTGPRTTTAQGRSRGVLPARSLARSFEQSVR